MRPGGLSCSLDSVAYRKDCENLIPIQGNQAFLYLPDSIIYSRKLFGDQIYRGE